MTKERFCIGPWACNGLEKGTGARFYTVTTRMTEWLCTYQGFPVCQSTYVFIGKELSVRKISNLDRARAVTG
jgi:hypothetical protein